MRDSTKTTLQAIAIATLLLGCNIVMAADVKGNADDGKNLLDVIVGWVYGTVGLLVGIAIAFVGIYLWITKDTMAAGGIFIVLVVFYFILPMVKGVQKKGAEGAVSISIPLDTGTYRASQPIPLNFLIRLA
jgi:type IV secretory pathway VirB2 component (pilin)